MKRLLFLILSVFLASGAVAETRVPTSEAEISLSFAPLVQEAAPAVVNIYAQRVVEARRSPFMGDPFFEQLFRDFGDTRPRVQNSLGSGVILSEDGIVVSNYHVVGEATDIRVGLNDRREFSAEVLLADEDSDLAILRMDTDTPLPHLPLRDSDSVTVGELVLAIGNPFGVGQTVTSGIVSGLARSGVATGNARGYFIQTDAPINPGNSGGALIDVDGQLIGVNTSILTRSGGSNGIGFAIPANLVAEFVRQAADGRDTFARPWAGIVGQSVDQGLAESFGLSLPEGIVISDLHPQSPFVEAGFQVGDVVLQVDGQPVNSPPEMIFRMSVAGMGNVAAVTRYRDGGEEIIDVRMIAPPDNESDAVLTLGRNTALPGLTVGQITPALLSELRLPVSLRGVVVVDPGPVGARVGLRRGDVLLGINNERIQDPADVERVLARAGRWIAVDAQRAGRRLSLRFRI